MHNFENKHILFRKVIERSNSSLKLNFQLFKIKEVYTTHIPTRLTRHIESGSKHAMVPSTASLSLHWRDIFSKWNRIKWIIKGSIMYILFNRLTNLDNNNQNGTQKLCQRLMREHNCLFRTLDVPYILHPVHTCPQIVHMVLLLNSISQDFLDISHCIQVQDL